MVRPVTPLDGSVIAEQAQALSRYLAERLCESLELMHAVEPASRSLFNTALKLREHGTKVDWEGWFDQPNNEILRASETMASDRIDMETND